MSNAKDHGNMAHLERANVFVDLKDESEALDVLQHVMVRKVFQPKHDIIVEGETGSELFVLVEGQANVYKKTLEGEKYKIAILHGDNYACFGEGGLLGGDARSATIQADNACTCLVLNKEAFDKFCKEYPQWALPVVVRIANGMLKRLQKVNNDMMLVYNALVAEIRGQ